MNPLRRLVLGAGLVAMASGIATRGQAEDAEVRPKYFPIPPQETDDAQRIEVREFFYYGCGACYAFEPYLREWESSLSGEIMLVRTPALRTSRWIPMTMVYLVLLRLGAQKRLHQDVFDAYHFDNIDLGDRSVFVEWAGEKGLDREAVRAAWESREVAAALELTQIATRRYGVQSVPTLIVDGRYLTSPSLAGGQQETIALLNDLVAKRRLERTSGQS